MKHIIGKVLSIVLTVIAALWCLILLLFRWPSVNTFYYWGGIVFGAVGLLIAAVISYFVLDGDENTREIAMLPDFVTIFYAGFVIVFNVSFVIRLDGFLGQILIIGNVMALLIYAIVLYALSRYAARVEATASDVSAAISQFDKIRSYIPELLVLAQDEDVKKDILALKRTIESENNMAQKTTREDENVMFGQLQDLHQMMRNSADKEAVLKQIAAVRNTAMQRNGKIR